MSADTKIVWTRFTSASATSKKELQHAWRELGEHIRNSGPYPAKSLCPWIKLATFGEARTNKASLRSNDNVLQLSGVEGDYDDEQIQPEEAIKRLERAGIRAMVYTSPSHTPEKPRWRVLAPLSSQHPKHTRSSLLARINGALGGILTSESFTLSQSYYYGRVQGQTEYLVLYTFDDPEDGECVDLLDELDQIAIVAQPVGMQEDGERIAAHDLASVVNQLGRKLRTKDGRRELLKRYIGDRSRRGLNSDELSVLVKDACNRYFDASDPVDWSNINEIICAFTNNDQLERKAIEYTIGEFVNNSTQAKAEQAEQFKLKPSIVNFQHLKPVKWALQGFVAAGEIVMWAGQPGVGKSTVFASLALVIAGFGPAIGSDIANDRPRKVIIVSEHAGQYERLFFGAINRFNLDPSEVTEKIILYDAVRLKTIEIEREIDQLINEHAAAEPPLILLDTASSSFDLADENSNAEVGAMISKIKAPVMRSGCSLWIISHAAKALGREDSEITPRGASAYIGDVHGTGSVFRDVNFPDSVFIKSLKNRSERQFNEIELKTEVDWHQTIDERGITQEIGIRVGIPFQSGDSQRKDAAHHAKEEARAADQMAGELIARASMVKAVQDALRSGERLTRTGLANKIRGKKTANLDRIAKLIEDGRLLEVEIPERQRSHHNVKSYLSVPERQERAGTDAA